MREKLYKNLLAAVMIILIMAPAFALALPVQAVDANELLWGNKESEVAGNIGLGNKDPRAVIASIIQVALGFLGIIAVVIILWDSVFSTSFSWVTSLPIIFFTTTTEIFSNF